MDREEILSDAYVNFLEHQSDLGLASILYNTMSKKIDKKYNVREFVRKEELIQIITEIDFTGKLNVGGFEDIRNSL